MSTISERLRKHEPGEDWSDFASKMHEAADTIDALVEALEARARISDGGTVWYIAVTQERNRAALAMARKER